MAKKRANGEGSIRRKPNGRWEGRYTLGIDPATGRAIQKSVSAKTQAECKEKLNRAIRDNRGIPMNHNEDYTVAEWCRLWFETYSKPVIRPNTAKTYANIIENHIVPAIGMVKLKRLTAIQIQQMYNDSKARGRVQRFESQTNTALSGSTVRRIHMVLSSALKQAVKERIVPYNPCDNCRIPRKEHREMTIIPPEKLGVYLREAAKYGVLPMFFLELSSGLRRGELLALLWDDLNVKDRILSVSKQVHPHRRGAGDNRAENQELCPQGGAVPAGGGHPGAGSTNSTPTTPFCFHRPAPAATGVRTQCPGSTASCWQWPASRSTCAFMI